MKISQDGQLIGSGLMPAFTLTGDHHFSDLRFSSVFTPLTAGEHGLLFRVQGGERYYKLTLAENNVQLTKKLDAAETVLDSSVFSAEIGTTYLLSIQGTGNCFTISLNDKVLFTVTDDEQPFLTGQIGFYNGENSQTLFKQYNITPVK